MKRIIFACLLLTNMGLFAQTQFLDAYNDLDVSAANLIGTSDNGWITVADIRVDSVTERMAVIKFDMCGDFQWGNFISGENFELRSAEIIQNATGAYHLTASHSDLSQVDAGKYLINLGNAGNISSSWNHSKEGRLISGFFVGTDIEAISDTLIVTEYESNNDQKTLITFDQNDDVVWSKTYSGLPAMPAPMAIQKITDSTIFVTNTFQVALLDTSGEVIWSMKNDSIVIWPEIASTSDNTIGILVSPLRSDSTHMAEGRRIVNLVTFPQSTNNPTTFKGDVKVANLYPELHVADDIFVMTSLDSLTDEDADAQTFTLWDANGAVLEQRYMTDFLTSGIKGDVPFIGFDITPGFAYMTYASADSTLYFAKLGRGSLEVEDMMGCIPSNRDTVKEELMNFWETNMVTVTDYAAIVDTIALRIEAMDTLFMNRQCVNEIPDGMVTQPICPGDTFRLGTQIITEEGTYYDTMVICEEEIITTYEVVFIMIPDAVVDTTICPGDTVFTVGGDILTEPGSFSFTDTLCGQEVETTYNINFFQPPADIQLEVQGCVGSVLNYEHPLTGEIFSLTEDTTIVFSEPTPICTFLQTTTVNIVFNTSDQNFKSLIPNAFTPNNDQMNDFFRIIEDSTATSIEYDQFNMTIINRWGQKVFETTNPSQGWNGNHNGEQAISEVYLYIIEASGRLSGCEFSGTYMGDVTLVK